MVKSKKTLIKNSTGVILCGTFLLFISCSSGNHSDKEDMNDSGFFNDSLRYEVTSEEHTTVFDKFRKIAEDTTLTDEEKKEIHKAQIRNILKRK